MDSEAALCNFLKTDEADELFNNYFSAIRKAFLAGYKASGGIISIEPLLPKPITLG